mmetsp:Transcript_31073/g.66758  ORF Transcript_31073/g.66758 Transcript_31073/m.66758 type:complete len:284 (+) Transcript_31073:680-1531(+)
MLLIDRTDEDGQVALGWVLSAQGSHGLCAVAFRVKSDDHSVNLVIGLVHKSLQHIRPTRIPIEDWEATVARLCDAVGVHVEGLVAHEPRGEQLADRLPDSTKAADEDVVSLVVLVRGGQHEPALGLLDARGDARAQVVEKRREEHGQHHHREQQLHLRGRQDAVGLSEREEHEGKLATLREQQPRADGGRGLDLVELADEHHDERLARVQRHSEAEDRGRRGDCEGQVDGEADGDEEEPEEQPAEGRDVRLDLETVLGLGKEHSGEEGAERVREAESLCECGH